MEEHAVCCICGQFSLYPLLWPCNRHHACYRCVHSNLQETKLWNVDINARHGMIVTMLARCPNCRTTSTRECADECLEQHLLRPPSNDVHHIHKAAPAGATAMCPYCKLPVLVGTLDECYYHLHTCMQRPMVCKLCDKELPYGVYHQHMESACNQWACTYKWCRDGRDHGMTLDAFRRHSMSHVQCEQANLDAEKSFKHLLRSIPMHTENDRRKYPKICNTAITRLAETIRNSTLGVSR